MNVYPYTELDLQQLANQIKDLTIRTLNEKNLLNDDVEEIASSFVIVARDKGYFGKIYDKVFNVKDEGLNFTVMTTIKQQP